MGRFQYTGQMWLAEAGLYHYKARAYLPALGRFAQTDPILFAGGMNLYAYTGNDPVNFTDPSGLQVTPQDDIVVCPGCYNPGPWGHDFPYNPFNPTNVPGDPVGSNANEEDEIVVTAQRQRGNCGGPWTQAQCDQFDRQNRISDRFERQLCGFSGCVTLILGALSPGDEILLLRRACGCFGEGTEVVTPEGLRAIEEIAVGDSVLAWNPETGETTTQTVTALIRPEPKLIWRLEARDGGGEAEVFHVTDDHPWYVEGAGWVETQALRPGQRIETADDRGLTILDIARTDRVERTYNLTVDGPHTFLVGEDGAVVHNNFCFNLGRNLVRKFQQHFELLPVSRTSS